MKKAPGKSDSLPRPRNTFQVATLPAPSGNGSHAPEADDGLEAAWMDICRTHDRAASLEDAEPEYVPARPVGMVATVTRCVGRRVELCFDVEPDLEYHQRVMVVTEVV